MNTPRRTRIKVRGRLGGRLASLFEGMTLVQRSDGSELVGHVADQAHLHGLLSRIRDLGLDLESVTLEDSELPDPGPNVVTGSRRGPSRR
jgi:hypothetical protein